MTMLPESFDTSSVSSLAATIPLWRCAATACLKKSSTCLALNTASEPFWSSTSEGICQAEEMPFRLPSDCATA